MELYVKEDAGTNAKAGLAVAIAAVSDKKSFDTVVELATNPDHGSSRVLLLSAISKVRSQRARARATLEVLTKDPDVAPEARAILDRRRPDR